MVGAVGNELGHDVRVLLRKSGTEPPIRVMLEATDAETAETAASKIAEQIRHSVD
ncbi:hypothetical protein ACUN9V_04105 [Salinicola sp. V024]|uniref:hypothetical protein n=1 Tax=Salinicola sp. V024 TaxID=3459609 RepID=UPI0040450255